MSMQSSDDGEYEYMYDLIDHDHEPEGRFEGGIVQLAFFELEEHDNRPPSVDDHM